MPHRVIDQFTAQLILVSLFSAGGESTASLLGTAVGMPPANRMSNAGCVNTRS